ncbi:MAG: pentapeptide repeat-containing protein, partial [Anaerolineales bacterium]|nr:pentapeptide repeat-containing protein [Anaerolineales bacterium]
MANQKQLGILKQGVDTWNHWRSSRQSARIDLSSTDFQGIDLHGANFYKANLRGANLAEANLHNADFGGAYLRGANVSHANLSECDFTGANLVRTDLRESILTETDLTGANLTDANLFRANLFKANLSLANLSYANLNETNLNKANFAETNFHEVTLKGVEVSDLALSLAQKSQIEESTSRVDINYSSLPNRIKDASGGAQKSAALKPIKNNMQKKVFFTSYHPIKGKTKDWHTLLVYAHTSSLLAKVRGDVEKFNDQIKFPKETTSQSFTKIAQGAELVIVPSCKGVTFNPERVSFKWMEDLHRADFRFKADKSLSDDAAKGLITIYVG